MIEEMGRKESILFITDIFLEMAGAERNIVYLLKNIDKNKFRPIICSLISGNLALSMRNEGYYVLELKMKRLYTLNGIKCLLRLIKTIKHENVKLIVSYHWTSDMLGLIAAKICRLPIVSSRRDMGYGLKLRHRIAYRLVGSFFDAYVSVSKAVKKEICRRYLIEPNKVYVVYNGVDPDAWKSVEDRMEKRGQLRIASETQIVGLVAGLRRIKGIKYFIKAAAAILKEDRNIKFLIVGPDQGEKDHTKADLCKISQDLGISEDVIILGKRDDIPELLSIIDVFVICSLSEGFSNAILEAMAAAKPIIATNVGGTPEVIKHGRTGFLIPPADATALKNAILYLLKNEEIAQDIALDAQKEVRKEFSLKNMIRKNEAIYEYVISRRCKNR